jgi:peptidoglycan hydrolase-like amidase
MAGGIPSFTQFSSSNGGWTARGSQPYLPIQADGWDAAAAPNPYLDWTTTVGAAALESRYPSIGTLQAVRVTERDGGGLWGGRVLTVVLEGSAGSVTVSGDGAIRSALGTRSSYLTFG